MLVYSFRIQRQLRQLYDERVGTGTPV